MASARATSSPPFNERQVEAARQRLQQLEGPYQAAQEEAAQCRRKTNALAAEIRRLEFVLGFRAVGNKYELWPFGVMLVIPSICGAIVWAIAFTLRWSVTWNAIFVFAAVAFSLTVCARLLWVPPSDEIKTRLKELDHELAIARRDLDAAEMALDAKEKPYRSALDHYNFVQAQLAEWRRQQEIEAEEYRKSRQYQCEQLLHLNWKAMRSVEFEQFLKRVFEAHGHQVQTTRTSGDQGVDLIVTCNCRRIAIQVKGYDSSVGNSAVQQAYAGCTHYRCDVCAVITNSRFTASAQELAASVGCILIDEDTLPDLIMGYIKPFG